jgi:hypothetical protein
MIFSGPPWPIEKMLCRCGIIRKLQTFLKPSKRDTHKVAFTFIVMSRLSTSNIYRADIFQATLTMEVMTSAYYTSKAWVIHHTRLHAIQRARHVVATRESSLSPSDVLEVNLR